MARNQAYKLRKLAAKRRPDYRLVVFEGGIAPKDLSKISKGNVLLTSKRDGDLSVFEGERYLGVLRYEGEGVCRFYAAKKQKKDQTRPLKSTLRIELVYNGTIDLTKKQSACDLRLRERLFRIVLDERALALAKPKLSKGKWAFEIVEEI